MQTTIDRDGIFEKLAGIAAEQVGTAAEEIRPETHLINDLNFDSLDMVEYVMSIEEAFDVSIPDEAAGEVRTVGEAASLIAERVGAGE